MFVCLLPMHYFFSKIPHNDRGYGHWQFAGAFAVVKRQGELKISEANAGAKLPEYTACPDLSGSASQ